MEISKSWTWSWSTRIGDIVCYINCTQKLHIYFKGKHWNYETSEQVVLISWSYFLYTSTHNLCRDPLHHIPITYIPIIYIISSLFPHYLYHIPKFTSYPHHLHSHHIIFLLLTNLNRTTFSHSRWCLIKSGQFYYIQNNILHLIFFKIIKMLQ